MIMLKVYNPSSRISKRYRSIIILIEIALLELLVLFEFFQS